MHEALHHNALPSRPDHGLDSAEFGSSHFLAALLPQVTTAILADLQLQQDCSTEATCQSPSFPVALRTSCPPSTTRTTRPSPSNATPDTARL